MIINKNRDMYIVIYIQYIYTIVLAQHIKVNIQNIYITNRHTHMSDIYVCV